MFDDHEYPEGLSIYGLSADGQQIMRRYGEERKYFDQHNLLRTSNKLGFEAKSIHIDWTRLEKITLPTITIHKDGHFSFWLNR